MQVVINIPEKTINEIKDNAMFAGTIPSEILWDVTSAIVNSTPLPKGHWEHGKELCKEYQGRILVDVTYADWHCSNCNYVIKGTVKPKWNYCPDCGAKMTEIPTGLESEE